MTCAGRTLPDNIQLWARRNLAVARSHEVSPEEKHHAQRALSIMMNIQWKSNYFEDVYKRQRDMSGALIWLLSLAVAIGYTPTVGTMHSM